MKVGDLVRFKSPYPEAKYVGKVGVITDMSQPEPIAPYYILSILFEDGIIDGISIRNVEVISESRRSST